MQFQHPGIARIDIEGDLADAMELWPRARNALAALQQRMRLGGISVAAQSLRLGDDGFLTVRIGGGINVARITVGNIRGVTEDAARVDGVPDFISGIITNSQIGEGTDPVTGRPIEFIKKFMPTQQTTVTHPDLRPLEQQGVQRLAVLPYPPFNFPTSNDAGTIRFSQYTHIKPTMYSGTMRKVVQALCGFGRLMPRQRLGGNISTTDPEDGEPINVTKSASIYARVFAELLEGQDFALRRKQTRYEKEVALNGLQIRYDHRFFRTHGVFRSEKGARWLVEISQNRGVIAMPLPLHPLTVPIKKANGQQDWPFRDELERLKIGTGDEQKEVIDEDGLHVLEQFGGFPTGESFPGTSALVESYIRAGEIVRLAPASALSPFYRHSFYSSAMGWAFNEKGNEAHNTGWRFDADDIQSGVHYQVSITISDPPDNNGVEAIETGADSIASRARATASLLENGELLREVLVRKAYRLSRAQIVGLQLEKDDERFINELEALVVEPDVQGSANLRLIREGRLWTGNIKNEQPEQIKFYEPMLGYLLSHDFRPATRAAAGRRTACDTTMHVFFDGNEFKWVRYFVAGRVKPAETERTDDFDDCSLVGTFTEVEQQGSREVSAGFYTSDYDDRDELAGSRQVTTHKREYLGPMLVGVGDDPQDIRRNFAFRNHYFRRNVVRETWTAEKIHIGIAVPKDVREAYYIGYIRYADSYNRLETWQYTNTGDPWSYEGWRCVVSTFGFAFWPADMQECPPGCQAIRGVPVTGNNPRIARYESYTPYPCSEYVDQGPWAAKCDNLDSLVYSIPRPPLPASTNVTVPRKAYHEVRLVCAGAPRNKVTVRANLENATWAIPKFNIPSPDEFGFVQNITASLNSLGDTESAVYQRGIDNQVYNDRPSEPIERYGPYDQTFIRPGVIYIGVV